MINKEIKLGDLVEDMVTGFRGIATARTKFLNGCIQYSIASKLKNNAKFPFEGDPSIDSQNLKVIKINVVKSSEYPAIEKIKSKPKKTTGGPITFGHSFRGY